MKHGGQRVLHPRDYLHPVHEGASFFSAKNLLHLSLVPHSTDALLVLDYVFTGEMIPRLRRVRTG